VALAAVEPWAADLLEKDRQEGVRARRFGLQRAGAAGQPLRQGARAGARGGAGRLVEVEEDEKREDALREVEDAVLDQEAERRRHAEVVRLGERAQEQRPDRLDGARVIGEEVEERAEVLLRERGSHWRGRRLRPCRGARPQRCCGHPAVREAQAIRPRGTGAVGVGCDQIVPAGLRGKQGSPGDPEADVGRRTAPGARAQALNAAAASARTRKHPRRLGRSSR
jgi:hypothetical protein